MIINKTHKRYDDIVAHLKAIIALSDAVLPCKIEVCGENHKISLYGARIKRTTPAQDRHAELVDELSEFIG